MAVAIKRVIQFSHMLMTVLSGKLAEKQSIALVRTFKKMKDYIIENQGLIGERVSSIIYEGF